MNTKDYSLDKAQLRQCLKRQFGFIDEETRAAGEERVRQLLARFIKSVKPVASSILAYAAHFPGEIDVVPVMSLLDAQSRLYLPRLSGLTMRFLGQEGFPPVMEEGPRGVTEPVLTSESLEFDPATGGAGSIVLVPGLAFSGAGARLGRGGGYYDKFLSLPGMTEAISVGICWECQILREIPCGPHDIPVQWLCTPERIFRSNEGYSGPQ